MPKTVIIGHGAWMSAPTVAGHSFPYTLERGSVVPAVDEVVHIKGDFGLWVYNAGVARVVSVTPEAIVFADFRQDPHSATGRGHP